jgi:hypothetical protein
VEPDFQQSGPRKVAQTAESPKVAEPGARRAEPGAAEPGARRAEPGAVEQKPRFAAVRNAGAAEKPGAQRTEQGVQQARAKPHFCSEAGRLCPNSL